MSDFIYSGDGKEYRDAGHIPVDLSVPHVPHDEEEWETVLLAYERAWFDIEKVVEFTVKPYLLEFRAFDAMRCEVRRADSKITTVETHFRYDGNYFPKHEEDRSKADVLLSGSVKWDGCSNWTFDNADGIAQHFCDRKGIENFGTLMLRIRDQAKAIPHWDE